MKEKLNVSVSAFWFFCNVPVYFDVLAPDVMPLYDALKKKVNDINLSELTWRDPLAIMVLSDDLEIVKSLGTRQKNTFMVKYFNIG